MKYISFFLLGLLILSFYSYGYLAKAILHTKRTELWTSWNIVILLGQIVIPTFFYIYVCFVVNSLSTLYFQELINERNIIQLYNSSILNRLSGDMRYMDRQLYINAHLAYTSLLKMFSTLAFTITNLGIWQISIVSLLSLTALLFSFRYIFTKVMKIRRFLYWSEAEEKGKLLHCFLNQIHSY